MSLELSRIRDLIVFYFCSFKLYVILNIIEGFLYFILKIVWVDSEAIQKCIWYFKTLRKFNGIESLRIRIVQSESTYLLNTTPKTCYS